MIQDENLTLDQVWSRMAADKQPVVDRCEAYAAITLPRVMLREGLHRESTDETHDYTSIGALAVNHLVNKYALAAFPPGQPFFRLAPTIEALEDIRAAELSEEEVQAGLSILEKKASEELDRSKQRKKLYRGLEHLIVTGNVLKYYGKDEILVYGLKNFCVKRNRKGEVLDLIVQEEVRVEDLDDAIQEILPKDVANEEQVQHYTRIRRVLIQGKPHYQQTVAVNSFQVDLPEYSGRYTLEDCPWQVEPFHLAENSDYGTGLVEEYYGDLLACSVLSEAIVNGGVLAAEFRYLLNPNMQTSVEDWNNSQNGDALAGVEGDIAVVSGGNPQGLEIAFAVSQHFEQRINRAFLLNSAATRDAERVTAEEIRMTARELEIAHAGSYSALADVLQTPLAKWLLDRIEVKIGDTDLDVLALTGLDALSRESEIDSLRLTFRDLGELAALPERLQEKTNLDAVATFIGSRRGIDMTPFLKSNEEVQQEQQRQMEQMAAAQGAVAQAEAAGEVAGSQESM